MRAQIWIALTAVAIGCNQPQPAAVPSSSLRPVAPQPAAKRDTSKETAETDVRSSGITPLTASQQANLLESRVEGQMEGSFGQFANMFLVFSRLQLGSGIGLMTSSEEISSAELQSPFPSSYKPKLQELMDSIALQSFSKWQYDPSSKYFQSEVENEPVVNDLVIFEFLPTKREKPFAVSLAEGWTATDRGHWLMLSPPNFPVGMDIYEMGTYSSEDKAKETEFLENVRTDVALEWALRVKEGVEPKDLRPAKVGTFDALHFEAMIPSQLDKEVHWRQWVFMHGNKCYFIVSTIFPEHENEIFPDVEKMLASFSVQVLQP